MIILRLCARCAAYLGQRYGKKIGTAFVCGPFFLFEVYYCPMLFSKKSYKCKENTLFSVFYIPEKIEILSQRGL